MSEIAVASIKNHSQKKSTLESPSEETIFVLTSNQLKTIIQEATVPLLERIKSLEDRSAHQDKKMAALESTQEIQADNQFIQLKLINDLRETTKKEATPSQEDRAEILRALLAANNGKMLAKDARKKMHLSRSRFSELLSIMGDYIEIKPYHLHKNWKVLILK